MMAARTAGKPPGTRLEELDGPTLARCRAGDPVALRAFVVRYQNAVFALLSRMLGTAVPLEDLAQETFLKAHRALARFDPEGDARASTWLLTITTRVALDHIKQRAPTSVPIEAIEAIEAIEQLAGGESPELLTQRRRLGLAIEAAAAQLADEQRAAFVLFTFHGFSIEEIARALDCAPATVKTRLFRARRHLRELLEPEREQEVSR
jgi:RNA polymerase sigma-70 factor, ECF subfamily